MAKNPSDDNMELFSSVEIEEDGMKVGLTYQDENTAVDAVLNWGAVLQLRAGGRKGQMIPKEPKEEGDTSTVLMEEKDVPRPLAKGRVKT